MKKNVLFIIVFSFMLNFMSCANFSEKPDSKKEDYAELLNSSLMFIGNNYRLKKVISKLRAGEKVCIACIGGSVTEGAGPADFIDGYVYQFNKKLRAAYTPDNGKNVYLDCAGLSGTPSPLGLLRYQKDVIDTLGQTPDLLIIEFAVNDGGECTGQRAFEALIRNSLEANPETAVIVLYAAATYRNTQVQMKPIADFYRVPQVSILDALDKAFETKYFTKEQYYTDSVHPTKEGHEFMADCLMNLFDVIDKKSEIPAFSLPEDWYKARAFTNFKTITGDDENVKINVGDFCDTDKSTQTIKKTGKPDFPQNWKHTKGSNSMILDITCKSLVLAYKIQASWASEAFGTAEIYVDEKLAGTFKGTDANGWNNTEVKLIIDGAEAVNHKVEIKMAPGDENKGFTICAMGYTK